MTVFDPKRMQTIGSLGKKVSYTTQNGLWYVQCEIRQLPGGLFRSGEVCRAYVMGEDISKSIDRICGWKKVGYWNFGLEKYTEVKFTTSTQYLPLYVREICRRLSKEMAERFPLRGIGVSLDREGNATKDTDDASFERLRWTER